MKTDRELLEQALKQTIVVKDVEVEVCDCGTPHKLYEIGRAHV
jgi:hypothetical protein